MKAKHAAKKSIAAKTTSKSLPFNDGDKHLSGYKHKIPATGIQRPGRDIMSFPFHVQNNDAEMSMVLQHAAAINVLSMYSTNFS